MADRSHIEWTDATWNPVTGCSVVSPGCTNCYAMRLAGTRMRHHPSRAGLTIASKAGPVWNGRVRLNEGWLTQPLAWSKPRMIFVCAHGDLFHESVPDDWIDQVFAVMALCPQHTFQVLTKRSARMRAYFAAPGVALRIFEIACDIVMMDVAPGVVLIHDREIAMHAPQGRRIYLDEWPRRNVWLGVSCEDQARADARVPDLLATPAALRFVSAEPLLGPIDPRQWLYRLDWVIVGGESGKAARPMHPDWARSIRDQCAAAGVPFFFKQWGEWGSGAGFAADVSARRVYRGEIQTLQIKGSRDLKLCIPTRDDDALGPALTLERYGKKVAGRLLDGRTHDALPEIRR